MARDNYLKVLTCNCCCPGSYPLLVEHIANEVEKEEARDIRRLAKIVSTCSNT